MEEEEGGRWRRKGEKEEVVNIGKDIKGRNKVKEKKKKFKRRKECGEMDEKEGGKMNEKGWMKKDERGGMDEKGWMRKDG